MATDPQGSPSGLARWRAAAAWSLLVSVILLIPAALLPVTPPVGGLTVSDKVGHFLLFLPVARSWYLAFAPGSSRPGVLALGVSVALGAGTEVFQTVVGWRTGEILDAVADFAGAVVGVLWAKWST